MLEGRNRNLGTPRLSTTGVPLFNRPAHPARLAIWRHDRAKLISDLKFAFALGAIVWLIPLLAPHVVVLH